MKVLITGGFGYLGGRFAQSLVEESGHQVLLGSRRHNESPAWLPQARVVHTEWASADGLEQICTGVDAVVHMAGMNGQSCARHPAVALESNAVAPARLLGLPDHNSGRKLNVPSDFSHHLIGDPKSGNIFST